MAESARAAGRSRGSRRLRKWAKVRSGRDALLRIGKDLRPWVDRTIAAGSEVGDPPVFDPAAFPWTRELESRWEVVRDEAARVLAHRALLPPLRDISPDHGAIAGGPGWRSYILHGYGYRRERALRRCPRTAEMLARVPGLETAFLSILAPGQVIRPHRGPTKAILTWHVPLFVPDRRRGCRIVIDGTPHHWEPGRSLLFDDTFHHEVRNETDQERVVLLMHVRRPVRFPASWVAGGFLWAIKRSPFVQDARRNQDAWEAAFEAALAAGGDGDSAPA